MEYKQFQEEDPDIDIQRTGSHSASTTLNNYPVSDGTKVRLRAVETEAEFFLKFLNVTILRWLILIQTVSSGLIMFFQVGIRFITCMNFVSILAWRQSDRKALNKDDLFDKEGFRRII